MTDTPRTALQLRSLVTADGTLELSLVDIDVPEPGPDEVVVRIEAAPINPSDLGLLLGGADLATVTASGTAGRPVVTATVPAAALAGLGARLGQSLPVGNEAGGTVVAAGSSAAAEALLGKVVSTIGGATYTQYRCVPVAACLPMHEGTTPAQAASCFVNPLTALSMVEVMRMEGHTALVHTAAASNLGQMLVKICLADGVPLVNIVRKPEQAELLRSIGAAYVCDSSGPTFKDDLTAALTATGATLAFDATGGGLLASNILSCMERALNASAASYSRYGSSTHKQVYIYGGLDRTPLQLSRNFGLAWGVGGWLLTPFLGRLGAEGSARLQARVAAEVTTTFASHYVAEVSLAEALQPAAIAAYGRQATGEKYLINPNKP